MAGGELGLAFDRSIYKLGWWFGTAVMLELLPVVRLGRTNPRAFSFLTFCHGMWFHSPRSLGNVDKGQLITLVVEPLIFDPSHDAHQVQGGPFWCSLLFFWIAAGRIHAIYPLWCGSGATVPMSSGQDLCQNKDSFPTLLLAGVDMHKMIDGCCGDWRNFTWSASSGVVTTVAVDSNVLMTDLHKKHSGAEVITGDLGDISVIAEAWKKADGAQILSAGFSCQPFSRLGDQRSGNDPRSESLPKALKAAYYLQSKVVLLECVTPAGSDRSFLNASIISSSLLVSRKSKLTFTFMMFGLVAAHEHGGYSLTHVLVE